MLTLDHEGIEDNAGVTPLLRDIEGPVVFRQQVLRPVTILVSLQKVASGPIQAVSAIGDGEEAPFRRRDDVLQRVSGKHSTPHSNQSDAVASDWLAAESKRRSRWN